LSPELEHIRQEVERLTHDWSESEWHQGRPGKWTCGQILEHLRLTFTGMTKGVLNVMAAGRPLGGRPTFKDRLRTFTVVKAGVMPSGRTAPKNLTPKDGLEADTMRRFYDDLVAMDATLMDAERRFGSRVKILDHPFLGPLNIKEWRKFHRCHARHHLRQLANHCRQARPCSADRELSV
jgi:hypothetical protein